MRLEDWQKRIDEHFSVLVKDRKSSAPKQPIFGLEHGLCESDIVDLSNAIRLHIADKQPSWDHRLAWVVYASEFGYLYSGYEYWQTFETKTPGWTRYGDRGWIRNCFYDFHEHYNGAKPTGAWAEHFRNICWPIIHAILPRDFQQQLAHLLYNLRYSLSSDILHSPQQLGELIRAHSWSTSSRFQQLTEEPLLVGQIATALLLEGNSVASSLIHQPTLLRISKDLDRERSSRSWLRGARESAQQSIRYKNIRGQNTAQTNRDSNTSRIEKPLRLSLEPQLILRPLQSRNWELLVELPDFSHVPAQMQQFREVLVNSRCHIAGSSGRPLARGGLLYGSQQVPLKTWPQQSTPFLQFEPPAPEFERLLQPECQIRPGPFWLFKVASDGMAHELKRPVIHSNQNYVLLFGQEVSIPNNQYLIPTEIACEGIRAVELSIPTTIPSDLSEALRTIGITEYKAVSIWPAGLAPVRWDGEGGVEWLSIDIPCIGICADHFVEKYSLELGSEQLDVVPSAQGVPLFVELSDLSVGNHNLKINAIGMREEGLTTSSTLQIRIREPNVCSPNSSSKSALRIIMDPAAPTLEQLWEDQVEIDILGPALHKIDCLISLFQRGQTTAFYSKQYTFKLPVSNVQWRGIFSEFKHIKEVQHSYDRTHSCIIQLRGEELGTYTISAEREFIPLRWACYAKRNSYSLYLIDDTASEDETKICFYSFDNPDVEQSLRADPFLKIDGSEVAGGLYIGKKGTYTTSVLIPLKVRTPQDFLIESKLSQRQRSPSEITQLIKIFDLWINARRTGSIDTQVFREGTLKSLRQGIVQLISGRHTSRDINEIHLMRQINSSAEIIIKNTPQERVQLLADLGARYLALPEYYRDSTRAGRSLLEWVSEFALRLASRSRTTVVWSQGNLHQAISYILENAALMRAAEQVVSVANRGKEGWDVYGDWTWD